MPSPFYVPGADIYGGAIAARRDAQNDFTTRLGQLYAGGDQKAGQVLGGMAPDKLDAIRTAMEKLPGTEQAKVAQRIDLLKKWHLAISQEPDEATRALMYNQMLAQAREAGADISHIAQQYDPQSLKSQMTHLLSFEEVLKAAPAQQKQNSIIKTYSDANGNEVAVFRDGSTAIIGKSGDSFVLTPEGTAFSRRTGNVSVPGSGQPAAEGGGEAQSGADIIAQAKAQEDARQVELARKKAEATASAEAGAKDAASKAAAVADRKIASEQTLSDLSRMRELADGGIYTGGMLDRAGNFLASSGFPLDQGKADRTAQIMQLSTQLKFGAKPPGMGTMTDSEWKIIQDAIPDPRVAGNERQLIAGISEAERRIKEWMARTSGDAKPSAQPDQKKATMRWNPATGKLEPVK